MAIAYVGSASTQVTASTSGSCSYSSTLGNQLLCCIPTSGGNVTGVTDDAGNVWVKLAEFVHSAGSPTSEIWATKSNGTLAVTSVTATTAASATYEILVAEYSGVAQCTLLVASQQGTANNNPTVSFTVSAANNWLVAFEVILGSNQALTAQTGNFRISKQSSVTRASAILDNTAATAISVTCSSVRVSNSNWAAAAIELKPLATPIPTLATRSTNANSAGTQGLLAGGTAVTITGQTNLSGFENGASVTFDGNAATSVVVVNEHTITCVTPSRGSTGFVDIVVTNTNTLSGTVINGWQYCKIAYVGGAFCPTSTPSLAITYPVSGANPIFVITSGGITSITDDGGNGYHRMCPTSLVVGSINIWMTNSLTPNPATTISANGAGNCDATLGEYEGVQFAQMKFSRNNGTGTTNSDSMALTQADNVMLTAGFVGNTGAWTPISGTIRQQHADINGVGAKSGFLDNTATTATTVTNSFTNASFPWSNISIELSWSSTLCLQNLTVNAGIISTTNVFTTANIQGLTPGSLLLMGVYSQCAGQTTQDYPTITGNGITWNPLIQCLRPGTAVITESLWWAIVPPGVTAGVFTLTYSKNQTRVSHFIDQIVGGPVDATTPISWCVQAVQTRGTSTSYDISLGTVQDANSLCYTCLLESGTVGLTLPSGFNGFQSSAAAGITAQGSCAALNNSGTVWTSSTSTQWCGLSLEITKVNSNLRLNPLAPHTLAATGAGQ